MTPIEEIPQTGGTYVRLPAGSLLRIPEGADPQAEIDKHLAKLAEEAAAATVDAAADSGVFQPADAGIADQE